MKRRVFLQRSTVTLAAWGLSDWGLARQLAQHHQVLAAPTRRKLALLIGINQYRQTPLSGCVTDVELQRELLQARYGFQPSDIVTLVDQQATREAIVTAFTAHLIDQAKPGDVVIFHFSGYGGTIAPAARSQTSLVTVDEPVTTEAGLLVRDLSDSALAFLLRSLATQTVTTVLDASYHYPGRSLQGNLRIRARPSEPAQLQPTELDRQLLESGLQRDRGASPGVRLLAAATDQLATETRWSGFSAGLFTYALTQQLWQATPPTTLHMSLGRVREQVEQWVNQAQQPQVSGASGALLPYNLSPTLLAGVDGVVTSLEDGGNVIRLWLGGLSPLVLEQYSVNSLLTVVPAALSNSTTPIQGPTVQLQLIARDGLRAKAKRVPPAKLALKRPDGDAVGDATIALSPAIQVGQFVREQVRVLPRQVGLTVALDSTLERIERVDAISAFSAIPHVTATIAGEQAADYLFSKTQTQVPTQVAVLPSAELPLGTSTTTSQSSYGLFSPGQTTVPSTIGEGGEAIKLAVRRLTPILQTLLATKLLNLSVNETASQLAVRAVLEAVDAQPQALLGRETRAVSNLKSLPALSKPEGLLTLPVGTRIQYRLENYSDRPISLLVLGRDSGGNLMSLYAPVPRSPELASNPLETIAPAASLTLPPVASTFQWVLHSPTGISETYLICSRAPFTQTWMMLEAVLRPVTNLPMLYTLPNPLEIAQAVLQDLQQASAPATQAIGNADSLALDLDAWATLRFVYQVV